MKLVKSLLLGSAAGMAAVAGAQAADLPFRKAAPVEYVRVCDWTGAGYFYIPGTDTCIKIGGAVRAEYAFIEGKRAFIPVPGIYTAGPAVGGFTGPGAANSLYGVFIPGRQRSPTGFFARGHLDVDTRTQTAYGTLRAFVRVQADKLNGNYSSSGNGNGFANASGNNAYIDKAYLQFAGITAGRIQSFFDLYADTFNFEGIANSDQSSQVIAYTAQFAGGFSVTGSIEDATVRRDGINNIAFGNGAIGAGAVGNVAAITSAGYAGERLPDFVGVARLDQAWGAIQLSGAYHEVTTVALTGGTTYASASTDGFAVQGGIDVKLPMLAAGDELFIEGAYQEGAYLYQDSAGNMSSGFNGFLLGGFQHLDADAVAVGNTVGNGYHLQKGEGFSVMAALHHYFTPNFHDVIFGSYEEIGYGNQVKNIDWTRGGIGDASEFRVGNQFIFTPVHGLDIGVEVFYARLDQTLAHERGFAPTALPVGIKKNPDAFEARLRMERDF